MKYIRTEDGIEQALYGEDFNEGKSYFYKTKYQWVYGDVYNKVKVKTYAKNGITKIADTIEELICDDDILYIYDLYPDAVLVVEGNIKPFGYPSSIKLKKWLDYKPKFDLFIKDSKGNYIKRAKTNDKGELELL